MGRLQRALTSLVAAVPAALLTWLLVQVFLNHADSLNTTMKAVVGLTLLSSVMVAFMPAVLMIPGRKKTDEESGKDSRDSNSDEDDVEADDVAIEDDIEVAESSDDSAEVEIGDSDIDVMVDSDDDVNTADNLSDDDLEAFDIDDEEDDPKSKKRKKKK